METAALDLLNLSLFSCAFCPRGSASGVSMDHYFGASIFSGPPPNNSVGLEYL
jgi:hypothetical protein